MAAKRARASAKMGKKKEAERLLWGCTKDPQVGWSCAQRQKFCYGKSKSNSLPWWREHLPLLPSASSCAFPSFPLGQLRHMLNWLVKQVENHMGNKPSEFASWRDLNQCSEGSVWGRKGEIVPSVYVGWRCCSMDKTQESIPRVSGWVKLREHPLSLPSGHKEPGKNMKIACSQHPVSAGCSKRR